VRVSDLSASYESEARNRFHMNEIDSGPYNAREIMLVSKLVQAVRGTGLVQERGDAELAENSSKVKAY
jgi:hypothetical protein